MEVYNIQKNFCFQIKKTNMSNFLTILIYKIVLDLSYYFTIAPIWAYSGFILDINYIKLFESYLWLFIIFCLMPKSKNKLSNIIIWLLLLVSYVPMLTLFAFMNQSRVYMYAVSGFWLLVFLLLQFPSISSFSSLKKTQSKIIRYSIFISLTVIVFILIYRYFGISFNFDLMKVYEIRSKYVEMKIPFAGYLFDWVAYIINPFFFALFLIKKKWIPLISIVFLQLLLFSATGHKTYFFALPFVLVLMWIVSRKNPFIWMTIGLISIIIAGMLSYWLIDDILVGSMFTRRVLLTPAQLSFFYYDFFSHNPHTFLSSHHIFRHFIEYPYELPTGNLISSIYFNRPEGNACNGIYGDAYMNFGFIGFLFWAILFVIILKSFDTFSKKKDVKITISTIAMPTISFTNSALLTCLLTHGLLLSLVLLYLLPKNEN